MTVLLQKHSACLLPPVRFSFETWTHCPVLIPKNMTIMGEIKQGILGGFSGKVGTVIGSTWKDVSYMRAMAISVSNPRTPKQQTQRGKFAMSLNFLRSITPYVREGYKTYALKCTPFNAAMSYNLRYAISGSAPDLAINYEHALVARGSLMPVFNASAFVADGKLTLTWKDNSKMGDAEADDMAMPLVYNKARGEAVYDLNAAARADATAELALPDNWADDALAVYLAFRSADGTRVTNSICLKNDAYEGSGSEGGGGNSGGSGGDGGIEDDPLG